MFDSNSSTAKKEKKMLHIQCYFFNIAWEEDFSLHHLFINFRIYRSILYRCINIYYINDMKKKWERCVHNNQGNSIFHASGSILPCINEMKNNRAKPNEFREKTSMFSYFVLLQSFLDFFSSYFGFNI